MIHRRIDKLQIQHRLRQEFLQRRLRQRHPSRRIRKCRPNIKPLQMHHARVRHSEMSPARLDSRHAHLHGVDVATKLLRCEVAVLFYLREELRRRLELLPVAAALLPVDEAGDGEHGGRGEEVLRVEVVESGEGAVDPAFDQQAARVACAADAGF